MGMKVLYIDEGKKHGKYSIGWNAWAGKSTVGVILAKVLGIIY